MISSFKNLDIRSLIFLVFIFIPKIDLIPIPGYWQGVRLEDLILLGYSIFILTSPNKEIIYSSSINNKKFLIFFFYSFVVSILSFLLFEIKIRWIILLRLIEYTLIIIFLFNLKYKEEFFLKILKTFIIVNFLIAVLQKFALLGSLSSLGYLPPSHFLNSKTYGIMGGSWELAFTMGLAFFSFTIIETNKKKLFFYFLITSLTIFLTLNRATLGAFAFSLLFIFLIESSNQKKYFLILLAIIISLATFIFFEEYLKNMFLVIQQIYKILYIFFIEKKNFPLSEFENYDTATWSLLYRTWEWEHVRTYNQVSNLTYVIGSGFTTLYTDSLIIRVFYNLGLFGTFLLLLFVSKLPLYYLIFVIISGSMLDLYVSMKIFILTLIYLKILKENNKDGSHATTIR